jgi:hypothetical protein
MTLYRYMIYTWYIDRIYMVYTWYIRLSQGRTMDEARTNINQKPFKLRMGALNKPFKIKLRTQNLSYSLLNYLFRLYYNKS